MNQESNSNTNANTADTAADAGQDNGKKKTKLRRFGGYAIKGAIAAGVVAVGYFGIKALLGNAGDAAVDALAGTADAVGAAV